MIAVTGVRVTTTTSSTCSASSLSKAIDKAAGAERERYACPSFGGTFSDDNGSTYGTAISNTPATDEAKTTYLDFTGSFANRTVYVVQVIDVLGKP